LKLTGDLRIARAPHALLFDSPAAELGRHILLIDNEIAKRSARDR
jgi:hypothetical protein